MGKPRLLSNDPLTGVKEYFEYDEVSKEFTIHTEQTIDPALQDAYNFMKDCDERTPWRHEGSYDTPIRVATIPIAIWQEMRRRGITPKTPKAYKRWLNSVDNVVFRTRPGRV